MKAQPPYFPLEIVMRKRAGLLLVLVVLIGGTLAATDADWPRFRGGDGLGVSDENGLPVTWDPQTNVAWVADVPGYGWSSPIV